MASLQKHRVAGRTYWRIVESRRVNGKPRAIPILYLGTADELLNRLLHAPGGELRIRSFQHGDVAALKAIADRLDVVSIINRHVGGRARGVGSVGTTLLLAAINRAVRPRSKRGWAAWAQQTSLERLFVGLSAKTLTSQFFWNQMDRVELEALASIEEDLTRTVAQESGITMDTLFYDATNFFTYIASTNSRSKIAQRGHSKQKRADLRLFSLALLVSRDGQIPLCSYVYEGNRVDTKSFPDALKRIRERLEKLPLAIEDVTIVYDRGNVSKANQKLVDDAPFGYVASLVNSHHPALAKIPADQYQPLPEGGRLDGVPVLRLTRTIWGKERTVLLYISEQLRSGQIRGLQQLVDKKVKKLQEWKNELSNPRCGPRSVENAKKKIDSIVSGQHVNKVLKAEYDANRIGSERLQYWIDDEARRRLETEEFGKRFLATDRSDWSDEEILLTYRGQDDVEDAFRQLKDDEHMAVRPQYHWTDQKIHVHTFCCLLALLLGRIAEREARTLGYREGLSGLLDLLSTIRLAMILKPAGRKGGRPRCEWQLEEADPNALRLFEYLVPPKPPFVYT